MFARQIPTLPTPDLRAAYLRAAVQQLSKDRVPIGTL